MAYQETVKTFDPLNGQKKVWERLASIAASDQVGSAYLLTGPPGSGKEALAPTKMLPITTPIASKIKLQTKDENKGLPRRT